MVSLLDFLKSKYPLVEKNPPAQSGWANPQLWNAVGAFGRGMAQASAPSRMPISFGQVLAGGAQSMNEAQEQYRQQQRQEKQDKWTEEDRVAEARDRELRRAMLGLQLKKMQQKRYETIKDNAGNIYMYDPTDPNSKAQPFLNAGPTPAQAAYERQQKMLELDNQLKMARQNQNFEQEKQLLQMRNSLASQPLPMIPGRKLSATEQKELFEAKDKVQAGQGAVGALTMAQNIYNRPEDAPDRPYTGFGADVMSSVARIPVIGDIIADRERGAATTEASNLVTQQALDSLKATFGGMPTEGERKVLMQLQALPTYTPEEQKAIIENAIAAAQRRVQMQQQLQTQIQTGDYFNPMAYQPFPQYAAGGASTGTGAGLTPEEQAELQQLRQRFGR